MSSVHRWLRTLLLRTLKQFTFTIICRSRLCQKTTWAEDKQIQDDDIFNTILLFISTGEQWGRKGCEKFMFKQVFEGISLNRH